MRIIVKNNFNLTRPCEFLEVIAYNVRFVDDTCIIDARVTLPISDIIRITAESGLYPEIDLNEFITILFGGRK